MKHHYVFIALLASGCVVTTTEPRYTRIEAPTYSQPAVAYVEPEPRSVVSVYFEPSIGQPPPIACRWAPPPMLVETPPPPPFYGAVWIGGYWIWDGDWVWAHGRWAAPPRHGHVWMHPYYENRNGIVVFVNGYWARPDVPFVPPPPNINITIKEARPGVRPGLRPVGPSGIFVPPPPGSRRGVIVPAPLGTSPAVVTGAPPVVRAGMRVTNNHNVTNNTTVVNNITNVTIVAPANATASGKPVRAVMPAQAHLAASVTPVVKANAPPPAVKPGQPVRPKRQQGVTQLPQNTQQPTQPVPVMRRQDEWKPKQPAMRRDDKPREKAGPGQDTLAVPFGAPPPGKEKPIRAKKEPQPRELRPDAPNKAPAPFQNKELQQRKDGTPPKEKKVPEHKTENSDHRKKEHDKEKEQKEHPAGQVY